MCSAQLPGMTFVTACRVWMPARARAVLNQPYCHHTASQQHKSLVMTLPRGSSTGNLFLLLSRKQQQQDNAVASSKHTAFGKHKHFSQPCLQLHEHPQDHGLELRFMRQDEPMQLHEQSSGEGPDALGIILPEDPATAVHQPQMLPPNAIGSTTALDGIAHSWQEGFMSPISHNNSPLSQQASTAAGPVSLDDLPDDLLRAILGCLDSNHRHVAGSTCERLMELAQHSFHAVSLALPPVPVGAHAAATAPASLRQHLHALPAHRFDTIRRLELAMPEVTDKRQARCIEDPCHPLNAWLASYLTTGGSGVALESLRITAMPSTQNHCSSHDSKKSHSIRYGHSASGNRRTLSYDENATDLATQVSSPGSTQQQALLPKERGALVSGRALHLLATHCPALKRVSLPLLAPGGVSALPSLAGQLHSFSCSLQDSGVIDAVLQLKGLTSLRLALHSNLLSCSLHQQQVAALAQISGLRSLTLCGVLLPESDSAWSQLTALTALTELRVSFPFPGEHLQYVTQLRALQFPTFTTPGGLHHLAALPHLQELRSRQALCEAGLLALGQIHSLQLDGLRLPPPPAPPPPPSSNPANPIPTPSATASAALDATSHELVVVGSVQPDTGAAFSGDPLPTGPHTAGPGLGAALYGAPQQPVAAEPPHPANYMLQHYAGLHLHNVAHLVLTGVHVYHGELGALFPNLLSLAVAAVELPSQLPPAAVPMPHLQALAWPASHAVPQLLAASPAMTSLTLSGVTSNTVLEAAFGMGVKQPQPAEPSCRLQHLALILARGAGHGAMRARALRASLALVLATPTCSTLTSITLKDTPSTPASLSGSLRSKDSSTLLQELMPDLASASEDTSEGDEDHDHPAVHPNKDVSSALHKSESEALPLSPALSMDGQHHQRSQPQQVPVSRTRSGGGACAVPGVGFGGSRRMSGDWWAQGGGHVGTPPLHVGSWCSSLPHDMLLLPGRHHRHHPRVVTGPSSPANNGPSPRPPPVDPAALAASGKVVDDHMLATVLATLPALRSLRVVNAGSLTCLGLQSVLKGASPNLEQMVVHGCPRVRQTIETLPADLGRPWLRVQWAVAA